MSDTNYLEKIGRILKDEHGEDYTWNIVGGFSSKQKSQSTITHKLEKRLKVYLYLKEKGLTLDEIAFLAQESWPEMLNNEE
ncbi:unnamed protein product [marine sediment metagenome]|uniref:Uncharacterized protein n=1 Tax=marine sediment metagenome TaxID=412755 RepID=X0SKH6_9ZZZZ